MPGSRLRAGKFAVAAAVIAVGVPAGSAIGLDSGGLHAVSVNQLQSPAQLPHTPDASVPVPQVPQVHVPSAPTPSVQTPSVQTPWVQTPVGYTLSVRISAVSTPSASTPSASPPS